MASLDADAAAGVVAPTGGLFGRSRHRQRRRRHVLPYNADAIDGFTEIPLYSPSSNLQPVAAGRQQSVGCDELASRVRSCSNGGQLLTADYAFGVDAVSAVFMSDAIYNEYFVGRFFGGELGLDRHVPDQALLRRRGSVSADPAHPFVEAFHSPGESNVAVGIELYDREEDTTCTGRLLAAGFGRIRTRCRSKSTSSAS